MDGEPAAFCNSVKRSRSNLHACNATLWPGESILQRCEHGGHARACAHACHCRYAATQGPSGDVSLAGGRDAQTAVPCRTPHHDTTRPRTPGGFSSSHRWPREGRASERSWTGQWNNNGVGPKPKATRTLAHKARCALLFMCPTAGLNRPAGPASRQRRARRLHAPAPSLVHPLPFDSLLQTTDLPRTLVTASNHMHGARPSVIQSASSIPASRCPIELGGQPGVPS